jgi:hypothetical protein
MDDIDETLDAAETRHAMLRAFPDMLAALTALVEDADTKGRVSRRLVNQARALVAQAKR